jgi:hypothetical protein
MEAFMVRVVASLIGTYFVAFAATSLVVAGYDTPAPERLPAEEGPKLEKATPKGDRLDIAGGEWSPRRIAEVELIGLDDVVVILRDEQGHEVYRVDHGTRTTVASRDVLFPQLRLHAEIVDDQKRDAPQPPARRAPTLPEGDGLEEEAGEEQIFACESGLSSLADRKAASLPRVCLSDASDARKLFALARNIR